MHIVIVANGDFSVTSAIRACISQADIVLACDNGASLCDELGRLPDLILGDLDSLAPSLQARLQQQGVAFDIYPTDKAMTDLEIALHHAAKLKPRVVTLLAALGGRWDQSFANLLLLTHPTLLHMPTVVRASSSAVILLQAGWRYEWLCPVGTVFSILPITEVAGITLSGADYPLTDADLARGYTVSVSNSMRAASAQVQLKQGLAWLVVNAAVPIFYFECLDNTGYPGRICDLSDTFSA